jgi:hypothetical protein
VFALWQAIDVVAGIAQGAQLTAIGRPTLATRLLVAAKDRLDVVAVGIKNKRSIVLRPALAWWAIVGSAFPERSGEKSIDLGSIPRHERGVLADRMRVKSIDPEDRILDAVTDAIGSNILGHLHDPAQSEAA